MAYNPYSDVKHIYDLKGNWDSANLAGDTGLKNYIAKKAQTYYNNLKNNGYTEIAKKLSNSGYQDAKKILDAYAPETTTNTDTNTNKNTNTTNNITPATVETNNLKSNEVNRENAGLFDKYNQTYEDLTKTNPFDTDTAKAILAKYDLSGLQARDNAVAKGSASNGGNIDSYAASNAMRQQAALVNQGQMAVLEAHQQKIDNVRNLLSDMGVNIDRVFNQDETSKNNDVARKSEIASVTGYVPNEWSYANNIYLNSDGTVRDEFLTDEFDATGGFTTIINNAKAKLATTTDETERANLQATINAATQAKALKTFSSPKYSKYAHEVQGVTPQITEERRVSEQNNATALKTLGIESDLAKYEIDTNKDIAEIKAEDNTKLTYNDIVKMLKATKTPSQELIDYYNAVSGDSTTYTVENPPPMTGQDVKDDNPYGIDLGGNTSSTEDTSNTTEDDKEKDIFTTWEDNGIIFKTFNVIKPTDYDSQLESAGVDEHGKKAIESVYQAVTNGTLGYEGIVSNYDLAEYLISQSDNNNTNKNQLKKVFAYFGLDKNMLEQVEDSGFWFWQWGQGTQIK